MIIAFRPIFILILSIGFHLGAHSQSTEFSGGLTYSSFLGNEAEFWAPSFGYQFGVQLFDEVPYTMDSQAYGISLGFFPFQNNTSNVAAIVDSGYYSSFLVETAFTYRYERFISDYFSAYAGSDVGFQFVNLRNQQGLILTSIQTRLMLAPKLGANVEFNEYLALYLEGRYNLSLGLSNPEMEVQYSSWQQMWNISTGFRFRF
ncbi:hypothetical protein [Pleomorphovibrio marinus]|uniref:hypothetical protein n=1 Tax=Pleomorphovibrio marinus TaxID=2164132 RepID=UPI000E0BBBAB|nr:hypothetical protein [Pleomorphovibrio marinus]